MQKLIEELKETIHEFIDQADDLFLVLSASDTDMPLVHKIIEGVDQEQPADIVLRFAERSQPTASAYADAVLKNLDAQITEVNIVRTEKQMDPWPALPASCHDSRWPERQRMHREILRHRMVESVRTADCVIVNPEHIAVALRYDQASMDAPEVVAKGEDLVAQQIREVARRHGVPIYRDVALARALHQLELGDEIPEALYDAVAEVLRFVQRTAEGEGT